MKRLLELLRTLLLLCLVPAAQAQYYVPDSSAAVAAAYPWIDISGTGTQLGLQDDQVSSNLDLGFTFSFGGTNYTRVRIASNGMLMFGGISTEYRSSPLPLTGAGTEPSIDAVMLPLWDDYQPDGVGTFLRYRSLGTAPNRVFIVSWLAVPYYCWNSGASCDNDHQTTGASATFQVQIHEQGHFVYRYGAVNGSGGAHTGSATYTNPAGGTVGYELSNTDYVQFSYQAAAVPSGTTILWSRPGTAPGGFNAFETATPAGSIAGVLKTKVAGAAFSAAVVALNTAKTAVATTFTGDVKVELINSSDNSGALSATTGCRSSWTAVLQTTTVNFAAADAGRDNVTLTENNAWPDLRLRMSYPATGTPTVVACSTDNFAVRPSAFDGFGATDTNWGAAGTVRTLANPTAPGGNVHKAGRPFTIRASAVNAALATTTNYVGSPTALMSACVGTACVSGFGSLTVSLTAVAGQIADSAASYSEAGSFTLQLSDSTFATVDAKANDSSDAERTILSPAITVGRFVPDHFAIVSLVTPVLRTFGSASCAARAFTYVGQPFGYATAPQATLIARNAAGATTANYANALWPSTGMAVSQAYSPLSPASPGLDVSGATPPSVSSNGNGTAVLAAATGDMLKVSRSATTPLAPFNADLSLSWSFSDGSEAGVAGNGTITTTTPLVYAAIAFDAGNQFRWGVLKLASAYGSELNNLPVQLEAQHWNGSAFVTNSTDQCTTIASGAVAMDNYQRNLTACETAIAPVSLKLSAGRGFFTLARPGNNNHGSVDLKLQLGTAAGGSTCSAVGAAAVAATSATLPWLQGRWAGAANYDTNPASRASFGPYKSPLIYLRESF
jgi:MSHA biogenesis protein MshQ